MGAREMNCEKKEEVDQLVSRSSLTFSARGQNKVEMMDQSRPPHHDRNDQLYLLRLLD